MVTGSSQIHGGRTPLYAGSKPEGVQKEELASQAAGSIEEPNL